MAVPSSTDAFARAVSQHDELIDLGRAALLLAADEYPGLEIDGYLKRLDMLAAGVAERMPSGAAPEVQVAVLGDYLFHQRRFRGNADNYYDPRNSYLSEVIDRRLGIPITLSALAMEVGARCGVPLRGVGLPGHFVVRYGDDLERDLFMDPFHGGRILTSMDCHELAMQMVGGQAAMPMSFGEFLHPVGAKAILTRMLGNLKRIYIYTGDSQRAVRVLTRLIQINPAVTAEYRERGFLYLSEHRFRSALADLTVYLQNCPNAPDAELVHEQIEMIWSALNTGM